MNMMLVLYNRYAEYTTRLSKTCYLFTTGMSISGAPGIGRKSRMIFFKGCERCGGELMTGSDQAGDHIKCLMCSRITYVRKEGQAHARWLIR